MGLKGRLLAIVVKGQERLYALNLRRGTYCDGKGYTGDVLAKIRRFFDIHSAILQTLFVVIVVTKHSEIFWGR